MVFIFSVSSVCCFAEELMFHVLGLISEMRIRFLLGARFSGDLWKINVPNSRVFLTLKGAARTKSNSRWLPILSLYRWFMGIKCNEEKMHKEMPQPPDKPQGNWYKKSHLHSIGLCQGWNLKVFSIQYLLLKFYGDLFGAVFIIRYCILAEFSNEKS